MNKRMRQFKEARKDEIPEYSLMIEKKKIKVPKWIRNTVAILIIVSAILYLPPVLFRSEDNNQREMIGTDVTAILQANDYLKNNPEADFDEDGLTNAIEAGLGTNPYRIDTDGDGITDNAEYTFTKTNPTVKNNDVLMEVISEETQKAGKSIHSPIKINNVILWPDNIKSRTYGTVVRTIGGGYRLCNFVGWALFPEGEYAYQIEDGVHKELKRNGDGAVYIKDPYVTIEAYEQPLNLLYEFTLLGYPFYLESPIVGEPLCVLLPDQAPSVARCRKLAVIDLETETSNNTTANIPNIDIVADESRFGRNQILLSDLARVRRCIEEHEVVLTSLFSPLYGESIVLVYGYTAKGNLLVADPRTQEKIGEIKIEERASRLYDEKGQQTQYEWFVFEGLGFSSSNKDRISFFSVPITEQ